jgi:diguanylate cyclase
MDSIRIKAEADVMRKKFYMPYILTLITFMFIFGIAYFTPGSSLKLPMSSTSDFNHGWVLVYDDETIELPPLPVNRDIETNEFYTIKTTLAVAFDRAQSILLRTSLQDIDVRLDGRLLYTRHFDEGPSLVPYASSWHIVDIPEDSAGSELTITYRSPYPVMSGTINPVIYGDHAGLNAWIGKTYSIRLAVASVLFFIGFTIVVLHVAVDRDHTKGKGHLGMFAILLSLWVLSESRMIQFVTGNQFIIGSLSYMMLTLFPIPMIYYVRDFVMKRCKWPYTVFTLLFGINLFVILGFQVSGLFDFFESVWITQIMIFLGLLLVLVTVSIEIIRDKNQEAKRFMQFFSVVVLFGILELINFAMGDFNRTSLYVLLGAVIFMILQLIDYTRLMIKRFKETYQLEMYKTLAYQDTLTGARNRLAYEQKLDEYFAKEHALKYMRLIFFDFDDLKKINDTHGHHAGDVCLKQGYRLIEKAFGDLGECYRIGGDEFACIALDSEESLFKHRLFSFKRSIEDFNAMISYHFDISTGSAVYDPKIDRKPSDLMKRADDRMYFFKEQMKLRNRKC